MMMSPLNILSSSALSNSSSGTNDSANRSPDCSKSPPSPALPPNSTPMSGKDPSGANPAASLLHAFAGNPAAMSSTLAQMFPQFQLPLLAAFYSQHPMAQSPYGHGALYGGVPQPQLSASILAAAKQMNPSAFLAMQSGKLSCKSELDSFGSPSKLSPGQQQTPGAQTSPNAMYRGGGQSNAPPHPLMPLSMMAAKGGGLTSPQNDLSTSSRCSHLNSNTSTNSILSPVLFSPMSASEAQYKHRKMMSGPNEASEVPTSSADSAFTGNFHRISRSPGSGASNTSNNGVFQCPICNISLEGVDIDEHYFEEMRKMDAMRKAPEWDSEEEKRRAEQLGKDPLAFLEHSSSKLPPPPPMAASASSYQKKLQLPQSRWETFQRIRQNRHARLAAFMRLTRRKWDAYESTLHSPSGSGAGFGNAPGSVAPHHSPSAGSQAPHQRSPNAPVASQPPPHHLASHVFEPTNAPVAGTKVSPSGPDAPHHHSPHQTRASPMSGSGGHSGPYPPMPFGQNASFFNFPYPYHPHLNPFNPLVPPAPPSYGFTDSMYAAAAAAATTSTGPSNTTNTISGSKIWRSVDTDQLESEERKEKEDTGRDAIDVVGESNQERDRVSRCSSISGGSVRSVDSHVDKIGDSEKEAEGKLSPATHKSVRSEESGQSDGEEVDRATEDKEGDAEDEEDDVDVVSATAEDPKRAYLKRHYADVFDEMQTRKTHHGAFSSRATPSTSSEASSPFSYYISRSDSTETAPVS